VTKAFKYRLYPTRKQVKALQQTLTTCKYTTYKAEEAGVENTTQICSGCGELVSKTLADRIHCCPHCGLEVDRDLNAAINICSVGITQSYAYGDLTSTQGYCVPEQAKSMK